MSKTDVAVFDLGHIPSLLMRAMELLATVEDADKSLLPDHVLQAAADFRAVLDEVNEIV